ncbi:type II secretion system protein J [Chloroflexota bacterium]
MSQQRGFTLIELLVVLAISSVILLVVFDIMLNIQWGTGRNVNQLTINSDLGTAVTSIHQDLMVTQSTNITDNLTTLRWTDYTGNHTDHIVTYGFNGINGTGPTVLWRIYDGSPEIVGRDITNLSFTSENRTIHVSITSSGVETPARSKTIEFDILKRWEVEVTQ